MNFFKSVFADEPESASPLSQDPDPNPQRHPNPSATGGWNFGDLIKTIATKSETVIETYRRDLQEFGSGLKKEIEVAQGSLETVGTKIDELGTTVLQGTAQIISHSILNPDHESDSPDSSAAAAARRSLSSKRYSRFESQLRAAQGDASTYCEEPEEAEEYGRWRLGFALEEKREEIEELLEGNGAMEAVYKRVAPSVVDDETFWSRYYFRVYKLKQAEDVRASLVRRAISVEEEDELSWDVDDVEYDEDHGGSNAVAKSTLGKEREVVSVDQAGGEGFSSNVDAGEANEAAKKVVEEESAARAAEVVGEEEGKSLETKGDKESEEKANVVGDSGVQSKSDEENKDLPSKSDEAVALEGKKDEAPASSKESGVSAASVRSSAEPEEEEDLGWDEIEDLSSIDEKRVTPGASGGSANTAELQKRLSTAEDEEDLSWDIDDDDDDEPPKG
ncbi:uncharacterized protein LOC126782231 isoform X2 [Argentina anserina]|uniref:uncharacterized protein LOC126782231 isoform X2 n=1 Tax=Argentina anserina TaxID=57926 RepID=UPI0021767C7F|nr:uncharacterized protein LOC126782231 isoform X2 [Potentilla anserina]